jgi:hypothetical protein
VHFTSVSMSLNVLMFRLEAVIVLSLSDSSINALPANVKKPDLKVAAVSMSLLALSESISQVEAFTSSSALRSLPLLVPQIVTVAHSESSREGPRKALG